MTESLRPTVEPCAACRAKLASTDKNALWCKHRSVLALRSVADQWGYVADMPAPVVYKIMRRAERWIDSRQRQHLEQYLIDQLGVSAQGAEDVSQLISGWVVLDTIAETQEND